MAGTIIINMTVIDDADTSSFGSTYSGFQREGIYCNGDQASSGSVEMTTTITSLNLSARSIHGWMMMWNAPDTFVNAGFGMIFGDGTNRVAYAVGGTGTPDVQGVFVKTGWQSFQIDGSSPPTTFVTKAGSESSLDWTSITVIGYYFDCTAKAIGTVDNVFVDIMWYYDNSNYAAEITAGTSGSPATFSDLAVYDFSSDANRALGVMYEVDSGVFETQAPIMIGDSGTGASYFSSSNEEVIFINKPVNNFKFDLIGNATGQNEAYFIGVTFRNTNSSVNPTFDWNDTNFEYVQIDACSFLSIGTILLPTTSTNRFVTNTAFDGCGTITVSTIKFEDNAIRNHVSTGVSLANPTTHGMKNCDFTSSGTSGGHGIEITATGTYVFDGITFTNYGVDDTTDAAVYNNSGGSVTINVTNGDTPTIRNGSGASTILVVNPVTLGITVTDTSSPPVALNGARVLIWVTDNVNYFYQASVSITGTGTTATVTHSTHGLSTGDEVIIDGVENDDVYNGAWTVTVSDADTYTYTTSQTITSTPATGTSVISTMCIIDDITDVSGYVSDTRSWDVNQPIVGRVRMSSSSPYYRQGSFVGTIDKDIGLIISIQLISDE